MKWLIIIFILITSGCNKGSDKMPNYSSGVVIVCINGQQFIMGLKVLANYPDENGKPRPCVMRSKK